MSFQPTTAAGALVGANRPGGWESRLREGAYTSPGGTRIPFKFEGVGREVDKRTTAFPFIKVRDDYVQDNGHGSRKYPLLCYFTGSSCDKLADAFFAGLLEPGQGKLEHPRYGTFNVVPFGTITQRDDLVEGANQSIVEVTFWTTTGAVYPSTEGNPRSEILTAAEAYDIAAAQQFANGANLRSGLRRSGMKSSVRGLLQTVSRALSRVSGGVSSITREFRDLQSTVNFGLDVLVGQPLSLARQIVNLISAPSRALTGIFDRLAGYRAMAEDIFGTSRASSADRAISANLRLQAQNDFRLADLGAQAAVAGSVRAVLNHEFTTKPEALAAAEEILSQLDAVVAWRQERFAELDIVDTGESYQALQEAVALAAGFLVQVSFNLVPERAIVLDRPRTVIDLCAELYGTVDDREDFFISSNNLTGSEILLIPRGRRIVYYPTAA
jgi:prophage DNA circulation protein